MKTSELISLTQLISLRQFPPIGRRVLLVLLYLPLAIAGAAWLWNLASPESLWQVAEDMAPFSAYVTSFAAMPAVYDVEVRTHEFVYALMLVGWVIFVICHAALLHRSRRDIPAWVRSEVAPNTEKMRKPWVLWTACLIWFGLLLDILVFGYTIWSAEIGAGSSLPSFGASMLHLGAMLFLFHALTAAILQRAMFRLYRDRNPIKQVGI